MKIEKIYVTRYKNDTIVYKIIKKDDLFYLYVVNKNGEELKFSGENPLELEYQYFNSLPKEKEVKNEDTSNN